MGKIPPKNEKLEKKDENLEFRIENLELRIEKQSLTEVGMSPRGGCRKTEGGN